MNCPYTWQITARRLPSATRPTWASTVEGPARRLRPVPPERTVAVAPAADAGAGTRRDTTTTVRLIRAYLMYYTVFARIATHEEIVKKVLRRRGIRSRSSAPGRSARTAGLG